jgi:hypothetical protein
MTVDSGEDFTVEVRGAFDDVAGLRRDIPWHRSPDRLSCAAPNPAISSRST